MDRLKSNADLREVSSENDCDVLISFVPIVSRAGTDIQAALEKIPSKYTHPFTCHYFFYTIIFFILSVSTHVPEQIS